MSFSALSEGLEFVFLSVSFSALSEGLELEFLPVSFSALSEGLELEFLSVSFSALLEGLETARARSCSLTKAPDSVSEDSGIAPVVPADGLSNAEDSALLHSDQLHQLIWF